MEDDFLKGPTLNKVFFWLTDAIFVIAAIILAFTKEEAVTPWVVIALLVGAIVGAFPYVLEYLTQAQMHEPAENPELEEIKESLYKVSQYAQNLEAKMGKTTANASGKGSSEALAAVQNELNLLQGSVEKSWKAFNERIHKLEILLEKKVDGSTVAALRQEVDQLYSDLSTEDLNKPATSAKNLLSQALSKAKKEKDTPQVNRMIRPEPVEEEVEEEEETPEAISVVAEDLTVEESEEVVAPEEVVLEEPELLVVDETPSKSAKTSKEATVVIAQTLIGIGNKPYIRGEGAGLSWDQGQLMEFVEIGKWRWVAADNSELVSCKIYKNDEEVAEGEGWTVEPGHTLECSPKFA